MTKYKQLPGVWSPRQLKMQELLANPFDARTIAEKAKEIGVADNTVYKWKRIPGWRDSVFEIARKWIGDKAPTVLKSLCDKAVEGDPACIKMYLEMIGKYTQKSELEIRAGRLENLSDEQLKEIIERGANIEGGSSRGAFAPEAGGSNKLLPSPQDTGAIS